jgi:ribosomal protein S27AE
MAANPISDALGNPYIGLVIVAIALAVAAIFRIYMIRNPGLMRAKCPKCGAVFDASRMFSGIHLGPFKVLTCPSCGKSSFMNAYSKAPLNWPPTVASPQQPQPTDAELERKQIEESKYEKP